LSVRLASAAVRYPQNSGPEIGESALKSAKNAGLALNPIVKMIVICMHVVHP
jgi:hypothetical protein